MTPEKKKNNETKATEIQPLKLKRMWRLAALVLAVGLLVLGEMAFQSTRHKGWTTYTKSNGLRYPSVLSIFVAPDGELWAGSESVVSHFDGSTWRYYGTYQALAGYHVKSIAMAPDGAFWFSSGRDGVSRFDGKTWTTYTTQDGLASNFIRSIAVAPDGTLWFGCDKGGVSHFDGKTWATYTTNDGLASNSILSIAINADGTLWFGTSNDGVSRFNGETWVTYTTNDGLASNSIRSIAIAPDGALWFGTNVGVSHFDGETWATYTTNDGLASNSISSVAIAPDGTLWFGTSFDGVSRYDGETWATYTPTNSGLTSDSVTALAVDGQNRVWVGTSNGLSVLDGQIAQPARPFHALAAVWVVLRVVLGIAALVLLPVIRSARQSIALWVLGAGLILSLILCFGVLAVTRQMYPLGYFVPIIFGLLVSLLTSSIIYAVKREWTMTTAWIVFVLATVAAFVFVLSEGGFGY